MSRPQVMTLRGWRTVRRPPQSNPRVAELQAVADGAREAREAARLAHWTPNNFIGATGHPDAIPCAACNRRFFPIGAAAEPRWWQSRDGRGVPILIGGFVVVCAVIGAALGVAAVMLNP